MSRPFHQGLELFYFFGDFLFLQLFIFVAFLELARLLTKFGDLLLDGTSLGLLEDGLPFNL